MTFASELCRWGPESEAERPDRKIAERYCRRLARTHYENFPVVTWCLPRRLRQPFYNVYAWCRWADDLADEVNDPAESLRLLDWWRRELHQTCAGTPRHPITIALHATIAEFGLTQQPFEDLISAFEQDQRVAEYETFAELLDYCRRSANPVGRILLVLLSAETAANRALADSLCTGLQLANFWQDVARDQAAGRSYIPLEDRDRFGYTADDLANRRQNEAFRELIAALVERTRTFLNTGRSLTAALSGRPRMDVALFAHGGLRILERIEAIEYRVWDHRPVLTRWDAPRLLLRAAGECVRRRQPPTAAITAEQPLSSASS